MSECQHFSMYFERGVLTCTECGKNCTPLPNVRIVVIKNDYRLKTIESIEKIANELPDDVLSEIIIFAEYLKRRAE